MIKVLIVLFELNEGELIKNHPNSESDIYIINRRIYQLKYLILLP